MYDHYKSKRRINVNDDGTDESLFRFYMKYLKMRLDESNQGTFTKAVTQNEMHTNTPVEQNCNSIYKRGGRRMSVSFTIPLKVI